MSASLKIIPVVLYQMIKPSLTETELKKTFRKNLDFFQISPVR